MKRMARLFLTLIYAELNRFMQIRCLPARAGRKAEERGKGVSVSLRSSASNLPQQYF